MLIKKIDGVYCVKLFNRFRYVRLLIDYGYSFSSIIDGQGYAFTLDLNGDILDITDSFGDTVDQLVIPHNHSLKHQIIYYKPLPEFKDGKPNLRTNSYLQSRTKSVPRRTQAA